MAQLEPPQPKQGWLDKRGELGWKAWAHRFFTLDENGLLYYIDDQKQTMKGSIPLSSITSATTSQPPASELLVASSGAYFQINTNESKNGRIFYLYCSSKEDTTHWIIAINYWRDYASSSGFGNDSKQPTISQPALSPVPQPYHDPSIPSAPPMESPYQRFLEFERIQQEQKSNNNISSPPYTQNYNNNFHPPPYAPTNGQAPMPPPPQRPLRTIDENACREILFTEGPNLKNYMDLSVACCNFLMQQDLVVNGSGNQKRLHFLCAYLVLESLDWDNRNTPATPYWCSPAYESDNIFPYFTYLISLSRQEILNNWPMEGPTVVTQIDTWIKRKRKDHQPLIQREDRDAFLKRNLVILTYVRAGKLFDENSAANNAALVLIDKLLEAEEQLPHNRFGLMVWKSVENNVQEKERGPVRNLLWAYLVFQKLKLENDQFGYMSRDPFLTNAFTNVLTMFHNAISVPSLALVKRDIQNIMMKIFGTWQRDLPLLSANLRGAEASQLSQANLRVVSRIMVKLFSFPQLYEAFQKLKTTIEQRVGQESIPTHNNTPFPSLPSCIFTDNPTSADDMSELGYVVRQALLNLHKQ